MEISEGLRANFVPATGEDGYFLLSCLYRLHAAETNDALAAAVAELGRLADEDGFACAFLDDGSGILSSLSGDGLPFSGLKLSTHEPGPVAQVFQDGETIILDSLTYLFGEGGPESRAKRTLLMRLGCGEEALGVMLFCDDGRTDPGVCLSLAEHVSLAIVRLRALDRTFRFGGIDPTIWAFDREWLQLRLEEEVERSKRYERPLSLMLFVFNNLDEIARSAGIHSTEVFLRRAAAAIRRQIRSPDVLAGYGRASIAVVLPESDKESTLAVQERIASRVARIRLTVDGAPPPILYLGAATCPDDAATAQELIAAVKASLHEYVQGKPLSEVA